MNRGECEPGFVWNPVRGFCKHGSEPFVCYEMAGISCVVERLSCSQEPSVILVSIVDCLTEPEDGRTGS
jgi:hypothetical protein